MTNSLLFDASIHKLNILFKYSGMNLQNQINTLADTIKYRWLYAFNFVWVLSATIASFYYIIVGASQGKNFIDLTSVAPCLTFTILAIIKSLFHLKYEKEVIGLLNRLRNLEVKENKRVKCAAKKDIMKEDRNFLNNVINVFYVVNCCMIVVFDMTPLLLIAMKYLKTNELELMLPYLDVFLFIPQEFKYWPFAYIHQVWSECIVLLEMGAADYLFFTCCTYIKMQFRLLKYDFERIIRDQDIGLGVNILNVEIRDKFTELVMWHQDLLESSHKLHIIYSKSNLFNFMSSSLVICLTGFNVTIVDDIVVIVIFVTFLFMGLTQVFFLCLFADMLTSASMDVSDAIYNCSWYLAQTKVCRDLLLVQTRATKPCKLTASGFADVNLRAFMKVLSTSWSYFALLQTVYSR